MQVKMEIVKPRISLRYVELEMLRSYNVSKINFSVDLFNQPIVVNADRQPFRSCLFTNKAHSNVIISQVNIVHSIVKHFRFSEHVNIIAYSAYNHS